MNSYTLLKPDGTPTKYVGCGNCNQIYGHPFDDRDDAAERCCTPMTCKRCERPYPEGKKWPTHGYQEICPTCRKIDQKERIQKAIARAEIVTNYDGWVFVESISRNDGFFESLDHLVEWLEENVDPEDPESPEWPTHAFTCGETAFDVDSDNIIENTLEDHYDDAADVLRGTEAFRAACKAFNEANKHLVSFHPDHRRAVVVPQPSAKATGT